MLTANLSRYDKAHLPKLGDIVGVNLPRKLDIGHRYRKFIVESYPGATVDNPFNHRNMSHCANIRALDNGERYTIAWQHFEILESVENGVVWCD